MAYPSVQSSANETTLARWVGAVTRIQPANAQNFASDEKGITVGNDRCNPVEAFRQAYTTPLPRG